MITVCHLSTVPYCQTCSRRLSPSYCCRYNFIQKKAALPWECSLFWSKQYVYQKI